MAYPGPQYGGYYQQQPQQSYQQPYGASPQQFVQPHVTQVVYIQQQHHAQHQNYSPAYNGNQQFYQQPSVQPAHYGTLPAPGSPGVYGYVPPPNSMNFSQGQYQIPYDQQQQMQQPAQQQQSSHTQYGPMPPMVSPAQTQQNNYAHQSSHSYPQQQQGPASYGQLPPAAAQQQPPQAQPLSGSQYAGAPLSSPHPQMVRQTSTAQLQPQQNSSAASSQYGVMPPPRETSPAQHQQQQYAQQPHANSPSPHGPATHAPNSNYAELPQAGPTLLSRATSSTNLGQKAPESSQYGIMPAPVDAAGSRASTPRIQLQSQPAPANVNIASSSSAPTHAPETSQYGAIPLPASSPALPSKASSRSIIPIVRPAGVPAPGAHIESSHYGVMPPRPASPPKPPPPENAPNATYGALPAVKSDWAPVASPVNPASLVQTQMTEKASPFANRSFDHPSPTPAEMKPITTSEDDGAFPVMPTPGNASGARPQAAPPVPPRKNSGPVKAAPSMTLNIPGRPPSNESSPSTSPRNQSPLDPSPRTAQCPSVPQRPSSPNLPLPSTDSSNLAFTQSQAGTAHYFEMPPPPAASTGQPGFVRRAATANSLYHNPLVPPPASLSKSAVNVLPSMQQPKPLVRPVPASSGLHQASECSTYSSLPPPPSSGSHSHPPAGAAKKLVLPPLAGGAAPPRPKSPAPPALSANMQQLRANQRQHRIEVGDDLNRRLSARPTPEQLRQRQILTFDAYPEARWTVGQAARDAVSHPPSQ